MDDILDSASIGKKILLVKGIHGASQNHITEVTGS